MTFLDFAVFWASFAVAFAILLPFAVAFDVRAALSEIDAVRWETGP